MMLKNRSINASCYVPIFAANSFADREVCNLRLQTQVATYEFQWF